MHRNLLLPGLLLMLSACAPAVVIPQTQIQSRVSVEGRLLKVTLLNTGPRDLLLKNDCPRPFALQVMNAGSFGEAQFTYSNTTTCAEIFLPPTLWRVGETIAATSEFPGGMGTRKLRAEAAVNVKLAADKTATFKLVRVNIPAFEVTIK